MRELKKFPELPELLELLAANDLSRYTIVRHGYRVARIAGDDVTDGPFIYEGGDDFDFLQDRLAAAAESRVDNHECYEIMAPDGNIFCIWFRDWRVTVGKAIMPY
ncbi:MAG TPA: hypothetical protein VD907_06250 [Verrucomicrobiae bacterium]|nr:hypothetical protein [Verrucomicrobiae bacterium]